MEKPILFNTEMVQAILEGRKTQTRRVIKFENNYTHIDRLLGDWGLSNIFDLKDGVLEYEYQTEVDDSRHSTVKCPYGKKGDLLWVRETWNEGQANGKDLVLFYKATYTRQNIDHKNIKWKPSIFMPKKYCRLWLEVVDVSVERVQDITEEDAEAEGINFLRYVPDVDERLTAKQFFKCLWDSINEKRGYGWTTNPWVWVVEFKRIEK